MADVSQNGWSANDRTVIASYSLPGGKVALRKGDVSVVLLWCANRWHETVEPLQWPGIWGYAERTVRGSSTTLSNHASGTAIDCNAPQHPLGTAITANFTTREIEAVRAIVSFCEGTVRWGGDYTGRKDGMHLEINAGAAAVKRVADKIRNGQGATEEDDLTPEQAQQLGLLVQQLVTGPDPKRWGWPTFGGGTAESLTVVDYLRRANVQLENVKTRLAAIETGKTPVTGPPVVTDADVQRIAAAVLEELGKRAQNSAA